MESIKFPEANRKLLPSGQEYSQNIRSVEPLYVYNDGEQCISCWELNKKELEALAKGAKLWVHIISGETQPPVGLRVGTWGETFE